MGSSSLAILPSVQTPSKACSVVLMLFVTSLVFSSLVMNSSKVSPGLLSVRQPSRSTVVFQPGDDRPAAKAEDVAAPTDVSGDLCPRPLQDVWGDSRDSGERYWAWPRPAISEMRCRDPKKLTLCCKPVKRVLILMWHETLFRISFLPPSKGDVIPFLCCAGVQFSYTTNKKLLNVANIVEFHMADFFATPRPDRAKGQLWMMFSMEGQYQTPHALGGQMNLWRSFTRDSDIFNPYAGVGECECNSSLSSVKVPFESREKAPFVVIVSNCQSQSRREGLLRKLVDNVDTHSFGTCFNNHRIPDVQGDRRVIIDNLLYKYKFAFAVENAICTDYVTEKFLRSFRHGIVPVVASASGKPGYERYAPTSSSYLDVSRFKDAVAAAEEINAAAASKEKYMKYHAYRLPTPSEKISDTYNTRVCMEKDNGHDRSWCDLASQLATPAGLDRLQKRRRKDLNSASGCMPQGFFSGIYG